MWGFLPLWEQASRDKEEGGMGLSLLPVPACQMSSAESFNCPLSTLWGIQHPAWV